jgi:RNase P subunit RPR2
MSKQLKPLCKACKKLWYNRSGTPYKDAQGNKVVKLCKVCGRDPFYKKPKPVPDGEDLDEILAILDKQTEEAGFKCIDNPNRIQGGKIWVKDT